MSNVAPPGTASSPPAGLNATSSGPRFEPTGNGDAAVWVRRPSEPTQKVETTAGFRVEVASSRPSGLNDSDPGASAIANGDPGSAVSCPPAPTSYTLTSPVEPPPPSGTSSETASRLPDGLNFTSTAGPSVVTGEPGSNVSTPFAATENNETASTPSAAARSPPDGPNATLSGCVPVPVLNVGSIRVSDPSPATESIATDEASGSGIASRPPDGLNVTSSGSSASNGEPGTGLSAPPGPTVIIDTVPSMSFADASSCPEGLNDTGPASPPTSNGDPATGVRTGAAACAPAAPTVTHASTAQTAAIARRAPLIPPTPDRIAFPPVKSLGCALARSGVPRARKVATAGEPSHTTLPDASERTTGAVTDRCPSTGAPPAARLAGSSASTSRPISTPHPRSQSFTQMCRCSTPRESRSAAAARSREH